jgi:hypothetical protein
MRTLEDCFGHKVRLTDERLSHILEHPEMAGLEAEIGRVLRQPQLVRRSRSDGRCDCSTSSTHKQLWVANGSVSWLNIRRTTRLWLLPI